MFQTFLSYTAVRGLHTQYLHRDTNGPLLRFKGQQQILVGLPDTICSCIGMKFTAQTNYKNRLNIIICSGSK